MTTSSVQDQIYEEFKKLDEIGIESDKLIELFDRELENMRESINKLHEEANEETKNIKPLFQDDRVFDVLKRLCKLELLKIAKEVCGLTKSDTKAIDKMIKQDRFKDAQDIYYLQEITEKFTGRDIEYLEKGVAACEEEGVDQEFDSFAQERVTEHKKREAETKQAYDQLEKQQLNKDKTSLIKLFKSLFTKIFRTVIEKLQFKKDLIEYKSPKEQEGGFTSYLPSKSLDDLTNFGFEVEESNPKDKMDVKSDLNTKLDQVITDKGVDKELGKKA